MMARENQALVPSLSWVSLRELKNMIHVSVSCSKRAQIPVADPRSLEERERSGEVLRLSWQIPPFHVRSPWEDMNG
jgi:hypothetical protein